jgi:hypothetical protein
MRWTPEEPWFDIQKVQDSFLLHLSVQTGCGTHPDSCPVCVVCSECVDLCYHYNVFVSGRVLESSMEKSLSWKRMVCQLCETPPPPPTLWGTQTFVTVFTPVLSQINPGHAPYYLCNINFNINFPSTAWSSKCSVSFWLSRQNLLCPLLYPIVVKVKFEFKMSDLYFLIRIFQA